MKVFGKILKVLAALAAVVGAIYLLATYGEKICAWARMILDRFNYLCCGGNEIVVAEPAEEVESEVAVQADEQDFEG